MKIFWTCCFFLFSIGLLSAQTKVTQDGYYRLWGEVELRTHSDFSAETLQYITLNHEGGLPIKVLEIGKTDMYQGTSGTWIYAMTTSWVWTNDERRVPQYAKFWIFLRDDTIVQSMR